MQLVVTSGGNETYATYIYGSVNDRSARAAVLAGGVNNHMLPDNQLDTGSNIDEPGRWMFRCVRYQPLSDHNTPLDCSIDELATCPAGRNGPPFCQQTCPPGLWGLRCANACR